jgi:hypothetical protein
MSNADIARAVLALNRLRRAIRDANAGGNHG